MRRERESEADSAAGLTAVIPWVVRRVEVIADYRLRVQFADGAIGEIDLRHLFESEHAGVFASLRDPNEFAKVRVDDGVVSWPGGQDLAPDAMYDAIRRVGVWTPN